MPDFVNLDSFNDRTTADFELIEIDRLSQALEFERERMRTLVEMLHLMGIEVFHNPDGVMIIPESPSPIGLGAGYMGLGAGGT